MVTRGKGGEDRKVASFPERQKGTKGDKWRRKETRLGAVNTPYRVQMMCYRIGALKPM